MKRRLLLAGAALALLCMGYAPRVHADVNDFVITNFTADETLSKADPQGELHIVEHINVNFHDYNHGILRAIPNSYKKHRLLLRVNNVTSDPGASGTVSKYTQNNNTVLKIGDPDRTITGAHEYVIDYTLRNVITFYNDHDELFWDINGDGWAQPFEHVSVRLHLPADAQTSRSPVCYTGTFGSTAHDCAVALVPRQHLLTASTFAPLSGYQTLSIVTGFKKGYFHPSTWQESVGEYGPDIAGFLVALLLPLAPAWLLWFRYGRDPKGKGVIVPEYGPPEGLGPIEVGTLIDFRTDNKDITAAIIDLAIRRYITIIEEKKERKLRKDVTTYSLRLENNGYGELNEFERAIMNALFTGSGPGELVDLSTQKYKLNSTATLLRSTVKKSLDTRGYFNASPITLKRIGRALLIGFCMVIGGVIASALDGGRGYLIGAIAGLVLAGVCMAFLASRTEKGVAAKEQVEGLKMYLEIAEKDRIKMLQSPNARYAANTAHEPTRTVELFEKLLPYAMILGVEQQWAKQFENIYRTPPDWYSGNWNTFSVVYLVSGLNSGMGQQVNSAFSSPSSSSGSGFGGGGAGGGGGGGGGGGW
jgi:uncharacterized membrane protein